MRKIGKTPHNTSTDIEISIPKFVPKNFQNTAPVYPNSAKISNFKSIRIRDKSIGLSIVAINENVSNG